MLGLGYLWSHPHRSALLLILGLCAPLGCSLELPDRSCESDEDCLKGERCLSQFCLSEPERTDAALKDRALRREREDQMPARDMAGDRGPQREEDLQPPAEQGLLDQRAVDQSPSLDQETAVDVATPLDQLAPLTDIAAAPEDQSSPEDQSVPEDQSSANDAEAMGDEAEELPLDAAAE